MARYTADDIARLKRIIAAAGNGPEDPNTADVLFDALSLVIAERYGFTNEQMRQWAKVVQDTSGRFLKQCQDINNERN